MKSFRTIIAVSLALIMALWWAVMPPRDRPEIGPPLDVSRQQQCPIGTQLEGKLCMCPKGSNWTGSACAAGPEGPDTRHVTTVDLRYRR